MLAIIRSSTRSLLQQAANECYHCGDDLANLLNRIIIISIIKIAGCPALSLAHASAMHYARRGTSKWLWLRSALNVGELNMERARAIRLVDPSLRIIQTPQRAAVVAYPIVDPLTLSDLLPQLPSLLTPSRYTERSRPRIFLRFPEVWGLCLCLPALHEVLESYGLYSTA